MTYRSQKPNNLIKSGLGIAALALSYATFIEPYLIRHSEITLRCNRLPPAFDGYRILLFSDLHSRALGLRERRLLEIIQKLPEHDLIAISGDLIYTPRGMDGMTTFVSRLCAADGVYVTYGNSEHKNGVVPHVFARRLIKAGGVVLTNSHVRVWRGEESIVVAGVDDPVSLHDDIGRALDGVAGADFQILLMHSPDSVALACAWGVDLVLSGHTHGGQIKMPFIGAPFTHSHLGRGMSDGLYRGRRLRNLIGFRPGHTQLYVSRGIGISGLALRFMCRPEITTITLRCSPLNRPA